MITEMIALKNAGKDSSWRAVGNVSILVPACDDLITQAQVARAINAFAAARDLTWPNAFLQRVAAAILRATREYSSSDMSPASASAKVDTIQAQLLLADSQVSSEKNGQSCARWGFFMIHKRGDQPDLPQLFLEIYVYQE